MGRVYAEESSALDDGLARMQWMVLAEEDWRCADGGNSDGRNQDMDD